MGQGTHTKIAQLVASYFGLPYEKVQISSTNTSKVPNTSASAASSTTDLMELQHLMLHQKLS